MNIYHTFKAIMNNIKECQEADIIIAALGQPNFVKAEMVKEGAVCLLYTSDAADE